MINKITGILLTCLLLAMMFISCAKNDDSLTAFDQDMMVEIIAGPAEGGTILNNANFAFEWRAMGGGANVSFNIQLSGVDTSPVTTTETSKSYSGQSAGSYTFGVTAKSGSKTATASRTFSVGANAGPPQVVVSGARGSASSGGSGETPAYSPGMTAFFNWASDDPDLFGQITGFRWKSTDGGTFNEFNTASVAGFEVPAAPGSYTFTLEAQDNTGAVTITTIGYEVKTPTVLIVDDKSQSDILDEIDEDIFYAAIFEGFAFANWDISENGAPTAGDLAAYEVAIVYSGVDSKLWDDIGVNYPETPVPFSEFMAGGGKIWAMGEAILEDIRFPDDGSATHSNPPAPDEFEAMYLHIDTTLANAWSRAGDTSGDLKFSFADNVLGDPVNFPRITMDLQSSGDVDHITAGPGAEIIYQGLGGLQDVVGDVGLRYPVGGTATQVVFFTFPLFENANVKASLVGSRTLTQEIMREMGQ